MVFSDHTWKKVHQLGSFSTRQVLTRVTAEIDTSGSITAKKFMQILWDESIEDVEPREDGSEMGEVERRWQVLKKLVMEEKNK